MPKHQFFYVAIAKANFIYDTDTKLCHGAGAHIGLEISDNLYHEKYFIGKEKIFNEEGSLAFTMACVDGLVANIQTAHQKGWKDRAEHLREVIQQLQVSLESAGTMSEKLEIVDVEIQEKNTEL